jgi:hypothetical protein
MRAGLTKLFAFGAGAAADRTGPFGAHLQHPQSQAWIEGRRT